MYGTLTKHNRILLIRLQLQYRSKTFSSKKTEFLYKTEYILD